MMTPANLWALSAFVLAPSVLTAISMVLYHYRNRPSRLPHITLMALSYIGLVVVGVCGVAVQEIVPQLWITALLVVSLVIGLKGLLLIATHNYDNRSRMRWWPERQIVIWAWRRFRLKS